MKIEFILGALLVILVGAGVGVIFLTEKKGEETTSQNAYSKENATPYVEIEDPAGFVNTNDQPIKIADYVGKQVILLDIMTYSCINCQRTFPYVTKWYETYKDDGLIVIGIHTPEFAFEKEKENVEKAMREFGITYPVVLDNDYATWKALKNSYWPRKYLIDIHGNIVYDHIGEGDYEETEEKIKELLAERAEVLGTQEKFEDGLTASAITEVKGSARSPETYFGSLRNEYLGNGLPGKSGLQTFVVPETVKDDTLYLGGSWYISGEFAGADEAATVTYRYNAKEIYLVAESDDGAVMEVWQDGERVTTEAGADAQGGQVSVKESRLYKIIKNESAGDHTLLLKVGKGIKVFAFTFG